MKNDIKISILNYQGLEIIDDSKFIEKIKNNKRLKEYAELELMRKNEVQKIIKNERIEKYDESVFDYIKSINLVNENGHVEDSHIIHGQIFTINYKKNIIKIIDKKIYEGHFKKISEYNYFLKNVGIVEDKLRVILNNISKIKQKNNKKNDCDFLMYILANRDKKINQNEEEFQEEKEIDNLFKLWNITKKYYPYKQYKMYLNLYEELYMDYLKNNSDIKLLQYEDIREQMKKIKKEILKGD